MMRQMRENTKWIMLATAIAFVALMVFEWGMDITGRTAGGVGELGRVNGTPISNDLYQASYRNLYERASAGQADPLTAAQIREIEQAAWDDVVNQLLIQEELARRGIRVTDEEIRQAALYAPPQELTVDPLFQTDGQFDVQKYRDFLANSADEAFLLQLEAYYRDIIPRSKLLRQVTAGIYYPASELWEVFKEASEQVRFRFLALEPATRILDSQVELSEGEIRDYYQEHEDEFELPATAEVKYVYLTKQPLPEDTIASRQRALALREEIAAGADFAEVARRESADQATAAQGGELGSLTRGQMVPAFDSVAFSLPLNRISEPVQTSFGFHLVQVESRRGDTVRARHILVPIERTEESETRLLTLVDSLEGLGETMSLEEAAASLGVPAGTQEITEMFPFLAGVGQISDGFDWVFSEGMPGEVSPVFEDQNAFYMLELVRSSPASTQEMESARPLIEQVLRLRKKIARATEEGTELLERARAAGTLDVLDNGTDLVVKEAGPAGRGDFFSGLGVENPATGAAFGLEVGDIGGPVASQTNVYLVQALEKIPADSAAWEAQRAEQRARLAFTTQQQRLEQWISGLRSIATIVDRREELQRASRAQTQQAGGSF
jgi:peptidyl-prolyl cis-trans isomerase D